MIHHYCARYFWMYFSQCTLDVEAFHSGCWDQVLLPVFCDYMILFSFFLLSDSFPGLWYFLYTRELIVTHLNTSRASSSEPWNSIKILAFLIFPYFHICLPSSGNRWILPAFTLPEIWLGQSLKAISWWNCRAHLFCFSSLTDLFYLS